jgi:hypothetical protein
MIFFRHKQPLEWVISPYRTLDYSFAIISAKGGASPEQTMESLTIPTGRTLHREIVQEKVFCEKLSRTSRQVKIMMPIGLETWNAREHHQGYYERETDISQTIPPRQV